MDQLVNEFETLINDSPIDEAIRHQNEEHIKRLVDEEVVEAKSNGVINTDRSYKTSRISNAAVAPIIERMGRWVNVRNDLVVKLLGKRDKNKASEADSKQRQLLNEKEEKKSQSREQYMHDTHYTDLESSYKRAKERFETMRDEHGGKPPVKRKTWLYGISILGIGFIEWFINYSTFNSKYPEGIAFGATILIALAVAFASHFHGALLKQRVALFGPDRSVSQKRQELIRQCFFTMLLIIALWIVGYNRYDILAEVMFVGGGGALPSLPGQEITQPSVWAELWPFILMNIVVWMLGVGISYLTHDSEPDYQEAHKDYESLKSQFFKVKNGLLTEEKRIDAEYEKKLSGIKNTQKASDAEFQSYENLMQRLMKKEESLIKQASSVVNDSLEQHQMMLIAALRANGAEDTKFGPDLLTMSQFQNRQLRISNEEMRSKLGFED